MQINTTVGLCQDETFDCSGQTTFNGAYGGDGAVGCASANSNAPTNGLSTDQLGGGQDLSSLIDRQVQWFERDGVRYQGTISAIAGDVAIIQSRVPVPGTARIDMHRLKSLDGSWICPRTAAQLAMIPQTDVGNGERLVARFGPDIRFSHVWNKYLVNDGMRWKADDNGAVRRMGKATARAILEEAATIMDSAQRQEHVGWWKASESNARQIAMLAQAASEPGVPVDVAHLDADPFLLNVINGTLDLRSARLRKHCRSDMITCLAPVEYRPDANCPVWDALLDRAFAEDADVIGFIQRLFGMALTGDVSAQVLPIFWGAGANGKSTMLGALLEILGPDYGIVAPPGLLTVKRGDSHPTERASLFRKRLVVDVESMEGARLNECLVKQFTGADMITARRMREDFWTFNPTHTIIMCTNHKPIIKETKSAIWRRLKLVPFSVEIPAVEQDSELPKRLRTEYPGILAWMVRGCLDWRNGGLRVPHVIEDATSEYRKTQDFIGDFLADECNIDPNNPSSALRCRASDLYSRYRKYSEGSGEPPMSQKLFGEAMTERGFERFTSDGTHYRGIMLREITAPSPDFPPIDWTQI